MAEDQDTGEYYEEEYAEEPAEDPVEESYQEPAKSSLTVKQQLLVSAYSGGGIGLGREAIPIQNCI